MEERDYYIILYDLYSSLFSVKQKEYFEDYYFNNLSLSEISENVGVSRNAIHKSITRKMNAGFLLNFILFITLFDSVYCLFILFERIK